MLIFPPIGHAMIWNNIINVIQPGIFNNQTASNFTMQTYSDNTKLQNISTSLYLVGTPLYDAWEMNRTSSTVTGILVGSIFFFLTLAFYLNQALESEEGFSLPFYFPFTISYWTGVKKAVKKSGEFFGDSVEEERNASLKSESVRIHKITKVFKNTTAVKEFSLAMEKGNVYGLLGHNGSGKTTTINILSGVTNPTYGNAFVFGYDVLTEINFIRSQMGVCSQFDLLYPRMTGAQHVAFYARFRNANLNGLSMELFVNTKLETVQLIEAKDQEVHGYSGGMKRRLSVALSTIGNDLKLIFLDEPTVFYSNNRLDWIH